jgi:hypothetical protein
MTEFNPTRARTIDGVLVTEGLRVIDYDLNKGEVRAADHIAADGTAWFRITLDRGGSSVMDGLRMWTRLRTDSGVLVAAEREEVSGDTPL